MPEDGRLIIPKVWRSEYPLVITYGLTGIGSVIGSNYFPRTIIHGTLIKLGGFEASLDFPVLWLIPFFVLCTLLFRIYNVRYVLDSRGIDAYDWVLGPQRVTSIRYEDIRSIESEQSIVGRLLDFGDLEIGTAAQSSIEVVFYGIGSPQEVLQLIQRERDRRHELQNTAYQSQGRTEVQS
jgi:uncharacterized membrane protein YdbT with pleckstrin-like domain